MQLATLTAWCSYTKSALINR